MKNKPKAEAVLSYLDGEDQRSLQWFFTDGQCAFEKSVFGAQLDRAMMMSHGTEPCDVCHGTGYADTPRKAITKAIEMIAQWRADGADPKKKPLYKDTDCPECEGDGFVPVKLHGSPQGRITAKPTGSSIKGGGREPSVIALETYGLVIGKISRMSDESAHALEAFFGMAGERWEGDPNRGRIWGVLPLTPAGKKLVKRSREKTSQQGTLTDDQVLNVEAELQELAPDGNRGKLLETGRAQAVALFRRAEEAWAPPKAEAPVVEGDPLERSRELIERIRTRLDAMGSASAP